MRTHDRYVSAVTYLQAASDDSVGEIDGGHSFRKYSEIKAIETT
jgi:hypothetical protein